MTESLLDRGALDVAFQPIALLEDGTTAGYRAIPRATAGPHGEPRELLDRAARAGTLAAVDLAWQRLALDRIAAWDPGARAGLQWILAVDGQCGDDPCFGPRALRRLVDEHRLANVVLEVELGAPGADRVARIAGDVLPLALAGLGAGHVTRASLRSLQPALVTLDAELAHGMALDPLRATLVRTITDLGARAGFEVLAHGLEIEADLDQARRAGVRYGLGGLLGRAAALPSRRAA